MLVWLQFPAGESASGHGPPPIRKRLSGLLTTSSGNRGFIGAVSSDRSSLQAKNLTNGRRFQASA